MKKLFLFLVCLSSMFALNVRAEGPMIDVDFTWEVCTSENDLHDLCSLNYSDEEIEEAYWNLIADMDDDFVMISSKNSNSTYDVCYFDPDTYDLVYVQGMSWDDITDLGYAIYYPKTIPSTWTMLSCSDTAIISQSYYPQTVNVMQMSTNDDGDTLYTWTKEDVRFSTKTYYFEVGLWNGVQLSEAKNIHEFSLYISGDATIYPDENVEAGDCIVNDEYSIVKTDGTYTLSITIMNNKSGGIIVSVTIGDYEHMEDYGSGGTGWLLLDDGGVKSIPSVGTNENIIIGRTFLHNGTWHTICLPFDVAKAQLDTSGLGGYSALKEFAGAEISNAGAQDEMLEITMTDANVIKAGTPYFIKWNTGSDVSNPAFGNVEIKTETPSSVTIGEVTFKGNFNPYYVYKDDMGIMFVGPTGEFNWPNVGGNIKGYRCYFELNLQPGSPLRRGMNAKLSDGKTIPTGNANVNANANRIQKLIQEGRVVIISDGVKYDLQGKIVQ